MQKKTAASVVVDDAGGTVGVCFMTPVLLMQRRCQTLAVGCAVKEVVRRRFRLLVGGLISSTLLGVTPALAAASPATSPTTAIPPPHKPKEAPEPVRDDESKKETPNPVSTPSTAVAPPRKLPDAPPANSRPDEVESAAASTPSPAVVPAVSVNPQPTSAASAVAVVDGTRVKAVVNVPAVAKVVPQVVVSIPPPVATQDPSPLSPPAGATESNHRPAAATASPPAPDPKPVTAPPRRTEAPAGAPPAPEPASAPAAVAAPTVSVRTGDTGTASVRTPARVTASAQPAPLVPADAQPDAAVPAPTRQARGSDASSFTFRELPDAHTVRRGDSLWELLHERMHQLRGPGSKVSNEEISASVQATVARNGLTDANLIRPPQSLTLVVVAAAS